MPPLSPFMILSSMGKSVTTKKTITQFSKIEYLRYLVKFCLSGFHTHSPLIIMSGHGHSHGEGGEAFY